MDHCSLFDEAAKAVKALGQMDHRSLFEEVANAVKAFEEIVQCRCGFIGMRVGEANVL